MKPDSYGKEIHSRTKTCCKILSRNTNKHILEKTGAVCSKNMSLTVIQKYDQIQYLFSLTAYSVLISDNKGIAFAVR